MDIRKIASALVASEVNNKTIVEFGIRAAAEIAADENEVGTEADSEAAMVQVERMMRERFGTHKIWLSTQDWDQIANEYTRLRK